MKGTVTVAFELDDCMTEDEARARSDGVAQAHNWIRIMLDMDEEDVVEDMATDCAVEGVSLRRLTITSADGVQKEIFKNNYQGE